MQSHDVLQQRAAPIVKEKVQDAVIHEIVFRIAVFIQKGSVIVLDWEKKEGVYAIPAIVDDDVLGDFVSDVGYYVLDLRVGKVLFYRLRHLFGHEPHAVFVSHPVMEQMH